MVMKFGIKNIGISLTDNIHGFLKTYENKPQLFPRTFFGLSL